MAADGIPVRRVHKVEKKGIDGGPRVGDLFSFRVTPQGASNRPLPNW